MSETVESDVTIYDDYVATGDIVAHSNNNYWIKGNRYFHVVFQNLNNSKISLSSTGMPLSENSFGFLLIP